MTCRECFILQAAAKMSAMQTIDLTGGGEDEPAEDPNAALPAAADCAKLHAFEVKGALITPRAQPAARSNFRQERNSNEDVHSACFRIP